MGALPGREDAKGQGCKKTGAAGPVTLGQIAAQVGVSVTTVSRVLSFDPSLSVGDHTRKAIIEAAEAMNDATPRQRRKAGRSAPPTFVLLHFLTVEEELTYPFYVSLRLGIESRCAALGVEPRKLYHSDPLPDARMLRGGRA